MAKSKTGPCAPYSDSELIDLGEHIIRVVAATGDAPASIRAQVEFHGTVARSGNGVRTFTLADLTGDQRARVVEAAEKAQRLQEAAREARPKSTYQRKGWLAQFRQLAETAKGRVAMQRAGVTEAKGTRGRWLSGKQHAGKGNQEAIARAYQDVRMENVRTAARHEQDAAREVAEVFDDVVAEAYGDNGVRFRDIES